MLLTVLERLRGAFPRCELALAPNPGSPWRERAALGALQKLPLRRRGLDLSVLSYRAPRRLRAFARDFGIVTECDVDAVLDVSGFAYGDVWGPWSLRYAAAEIPRLRRHGKPYLLLPQTLGPFAPSRSARRFGRALEAAALLAARDTLSARHLRVLNPALDDTVECYPDITIGVRGDPAGARRRGVDERTVLFVPNRHMVSARNPDPAWRAGYVALFAVLARAAIERGRTVRFLAHEGREDAPLCAAIRAAVDAGMGVASGCEIIDENDPRAAKGLIGAAGAVVSSRYHACVGALSQGVPCLGTAWSHKYEALFTDFGVSHWLQHRCETASAVQLLDGLLASGSLPGPALLQRTQELAGRLEALWDRVTAILGACE